jgi:hypothetical protein
MDENYIEEQDKQSHNDIAITNIRKNAKHKSTKVIVCKRNISRNDMMNSNITNTKTKAYCQEIEIENKKRYKKRNNNNYNDEEKIVSKVRLNRACIYLWFCFARRRRITDNVLLDEGMDIISRRLDIFNIFEKMYKAEHSPIRERKFWVEVKNCPTFVANHFRTHNVGVEHFHLSHRSDRTGVKDQESNRLTPTSFSFMCNAQSLINMARKRLCHKASPETRDVMWLIKQCLLDGVDFPLGELLVPECDYRKGCNELKSCGRYDNNGGRN